MRISHRFRFVFLAHARTASRSVRSLLDPYSDVISVHKSEISSDFPFYRHMPARELVEHFDRLGWDQNNDYVWFMCVRNPFTRIFSLHRLYQSMHGVCSIEEFVLNKLNVESPMYCSAIYFGQTADGKQAIHHYLRYESLEQDLKALLPRLGIKENFSLPEIGRESAAHRSPRLSKAVHQRVSEIYADDIEHFGYRNPWRDT